MQEMLEARHGGARFVGVARFSGWFACTVWPRAAVEQMLPPALALANRGSANGDSHPLFFLFGQQQEGSILFGGMTVPMGQQFTEFGVAIPYVTRRNERHLHTYVPRMYSSLFPPVRDGNVHYGYNKELATLDQHGPIVTLSTAAGPLLWQALVEPTGPWQRDVASAGLAALQTVFALPIIGRKHDGGYVRSYFDFGWDEAVIRPIRCAMTIEQALIEQLQPQHCETADDAAFEVRGLLWRLSWPQPLDGR